MLLHILCFVIARRNGCEAKPKQTLNKIPHSIRNRLRNLFFTMPDSIKVIVMEKIYCVYIMTNKNNTVLYTGVTNNLRRRVYVHKEKKVEGFTKKYNVIKLVYYEVFRDVKNAISREKRIKGGSRAKKIELINGMNAGWRDLYDGL